MEQCLEKLKSVVPDLDVDAGIDYCGGMEEFYMEVLWDYVNDELGAELQSLFEAGNFQNYQVQAHALKSTSRTLGIECVGALAEKLEHAVKDGNLDYVKENHAQCIETYNKVVGYIREYIPPVEE